MSEAKVVWLTGLSGAGKSTLAEGLVKALRARGERVALLDGDALRRGLCADLGYSDADRIENIRRTSEVARLMLDQGLWVLVALISPFQRDRALARGKFQPGQFVEVHVHVPLEVAERRDPKGLYAKVRRGEIRHFTGIDSPYEAPIAPEVRIDTTSTSVPDAVNRLLAAVSV